MTGRGKQWGFSVPETSLGLKSLRKCKMKEKGDDVVLIDVDNDSFPNVILLDIPETQQQNLRSSGLQRKGKNLPSPSIISIDYDEGTKGNNKNSSGGEFDSDATSHKRSYAVPNCTNNSGDSDGEECKFVEERYPVKISKCKRTYSKKAPSGKRYGLVMEPGSSSSEIDCSDCEILECSSRKFCEQWEEASLKRKRFHDPRSAQFGMEDQASASDSHTSTDDIVYDENAEELHMEAPGCSGSSNSAWENGNPSASFAAKDLGGCSLDPESGLHLANFRENIQINSPSPSETEAGTEAFHKKKDLKNHSSRVQNENGECGPDDNVTCTFQDSMLGVREKIKETDEYKQAIEEEWASRQRQVLIQAEEAQRLRNRRKAEAMRLLDMENRKKLRLEAIRETQKKVEERMSLKEELRVEVRRELQKLELVCQDMASLLHGLGIPVEGGCSPLSHQVHAAYKQALLRFHPDRASRTDIRLQVEAEEKFKLISRMKEKLLAAS